MPFDWARREVQMDAMDADASKDVRSLSERMNYILHEFHEPLAGDLDRTSRSIARLSEELSEQFGQARTPIEDHVHRAGHALFPLLRAGHAAPALSALQQSHERVAQAVEHMRRLAVGLPPDEATQVEALAAQVERLYAAERQLVISTRGNA
jgi:iron-sulfur cluster repair protein YtfE (RIC family)